MTVAKENNFFLLTFNLSSLVLPLAPVSVLVSYSPSTELIDVPESPPVLDSRFSYQCSQSLNLFY
jgi:hypothetical protein